MTETAKAASGTGSLVEDSPEAEIGGSAEPNLTKVESSEAGQSPGWIARSWRKVRWRAHWLLPNIVPLDADEKEYFQRTDHEINEGSRVPESEQLRFRVVWGVEVYGPAEVEALYAGLRALKWRAGFGRSQDDAAVKWVEHQRAYGGAGGWYNVGHVISHGDRTRSFMIDNYASIPEEVERLQVGIFQLTPSLTAVLVGFVFKEQFERKYEYELNRDRRTKRQRKPGRFSIAILRPDHLKEQALEKVRASARSIVQMWFETNLPGFFSGLLGERMPTAELVTTRASNVLADLDRHSSALRMDWRRIVAHGSRFEVWTLSESSALRFGPLNRGWTNQSSHLVVALCTSDVPEDALKHRGGPSRNAFVAYCHDRLDGVLINYASIVFLREISKDLKTSRATLGIGKVRRRTGMRVLEQIQEFFDRSLGTPAVASELQERASSPGYYRNDCGGFSSPSWTKAELPRELATELCDRTRQLASDVIREEHSTREHFEQLSTILSVKESVRAQRRMELLTVVALIVATASLLVALPSTNELPHQVWAYLERMAMALGIAM